MILTAIERETLEFLCMPRRLDSMPNENQQAAYRLEERGFLEKMGKHNGSCWRLTDAGCAALAAYPSLPFRTPREHVATTPEEKVILDHLVAAWSQWCRLPDKHPDDLNEFRFHVHALQNMLAWRVAQRADPEVWGVGDTPPESGR